MALSRRPSLLEALGGEEVVPSNPQPPRDGQKFPDTAAWTFTNNKRPGPGGSRMQFPPGGGAGRAGGGGALDSSMSLLTQSSVTGGGHGPGSSLNSSIISVPGGDLASMTLTGAGGSTNNNSTRRRSSGSLAGATSGNPMNVHQQQAQSMQPHASILVNTTAGGSQSSTSKTVTIAEGHAEDMQKMGIKASVSTSLKQGGFLVQQPQQQPQDANSANSTKYSEGFLFTPHDQDLERYVGAPGREPMQVPQAFQDVPTSASRPFRRGSAQIHRDMEAEQAEQADAAKMLTEHSILLPRLNSKKSAENSVPGLAQPSHGGNLHGRSSNNGGNINGGVTTSSSFTVGGSRPSELYGFANTSEQLQETAVFRSSARSSATSVDQNSHTFFSGGGNYFGTTAGYEDSSASSYSPPEIASSRAASGLDFGEVGMKLQEAVLRVVVDGLLHMKNMQHVEFVDWVKGTTATHTRYILREMVEIPVRQIMEQMGREAARNAKTENKDLRQAEAEEAARTFASLRSYLLDISHLKNITRSAHPNADEINANALKSCEDVQFFEPLRHLPDSAQELCREIVREKVMGVATKLTEQYSEKLRTLEDKLSAARNNLNMLSVSQTGSVDGVGAFGQIAGMGAQALIDGYEARIEVLELELNEKQEAWAAREQDLLEEMKQVGANGNDQARAEVEALQNRISVFETQIQANRDENKQLLGKLDYMEAELDENRALLASKDQEIASEKAKVIEKEREKESLQAELEKGKKEKSKKELEREVKETEVYQNLLRDYDALEDGQRRLKESVDALRETDKEMRGLTAKQEIDLEKQRKQIQWMRLQLDDREKGKQELVSKVEELQREVRCLKNGRSAGDDPSATEENFSGESGTGSGASSSSNNLYDIEYDKELEAELHICKTTDMQRRRQRELIGALQGQRKDVQILRDALDQVHIRLDERERKMLHMKDAKTRYKEILRSIWRDEHFYLMRRRSIASTSAGKQGSASAGEGTTAGGTTIAGGATSSSSSSSSNIAKEKGTGASSKNGASSNAKVSSAASGTAPSSSTTTDYLQLNDVEFSDSENELNDDDLDQTPALQDAKKLLEMKQRIARKNSSCAVKGVRIMEGTKAPTSSPIKQPSTTTTATTRTLELSSSSDFPRYSDGAVFSRLYTDFVTRLDSMREYRDAVCTAREGVMLKIYEAQKRIVDFLEPHGRLSTLSDRTSTAAYAESQYAGFGDRGTFGGGSAGGLLNTTKGGIGGGRNSQTGVGGTESYFAEFVTLLKKAEDQELQKKESKRRSSYGQVAGINQILSSSANTGGNFATTIPQGPPPTYAVEQVAPGRVSTISRVSKSEIVFPTTTTAIGAANAMFTSSSGDPVLQGQLLQQSALSNTMLTSAMKSSYPSAPPGVARRTTRDSRQHSLPQILPANGVSYLTRNSGAANISHSWSQQE
ncbi:unnamed protein product [Amoebophrya sp. A25]|nr:unnamed protein product [Amoebophrya sp. A25]|eukprot:GSA25T00022309001.1